MSSQLSASWSEELIDVSKFGAMPNDTADDTPAVFKALQALEEQGADGLRFPQGSYRFVDAGRTPPPNALFKIKGRKHFTLDGDGSDFWFEGFVTAFDFSDCETVELRNVKIDYVTAPFSMGKIRSVTHHEPKGTTVEVHAMEGHPFRQMRQVIAMNEFDPGTHLPLSNGLESYWDVETVEPVGKDTLRVTTRNTFRVNEGRWLLLRHQVYGYNAFHFHRCGKVEVEDVTVHCTPGMGMVLEVCDQVKLNRFNVRPRDGSPRLMSSTADACHFKGCTEKITITDCVFERMGDDAINVKSGLYLTVLEKVDSRTVIAQHNLKIPDLPDVGDIIEFTPRDTLIPYANLRVAKAEAGEPGYRHRVTFTDELPEECKVGDLLGNASRVAKLRVSGCRVFGNRARGALVQTRDAVVEDCEFEQVTAGGVWVLTEVAYFCESIPSKNVIVRNNRFLNCGYAPPYGEGILNVYALLEEFKSPTKPGIFEHILLENNRIDGCGNSGIFVSGAKDLVLRGNHIEGACVSPTRPSGAAAIYIMASENVTVEENTAVPGHQGPGWERSFEIGPHNRAETITQRQNQGF